MSKIFTICHILSSERLGMEQTADEFRRLKIQGILDFSMFPNLRSGANQNILDYLYNWNYEDKFSHPQYDADVNTTMISPKPIENFTKDDEQAKLVRHQLTKYALNLFKVMANRSFVESKLDLKRDLNYTDGNVNEFVIKWYLKEINKTRGDIFFTKGNITKEVRGRELNNLIIDLLNKKLSGTTVKIPDDTRSPIDETLRNLDQGKYEERIRKLEKEKINRERLRKIEEERITKERIMNLQNGNTNKQIENQKIDITKLNTSNYEYLMLQKIKENYKNKKYDDPYISLSDLDRQLHNNGEDGPTPYPGRQYLNPDHPEIGPNYPHPNEYPLIPGRQNPPEPAYPAFPVHPATIYPSRNPGVPGAFPSPEEMGIELRPGEPGYSGTPGIPGPTHGIAWTPPIPHFGPTGVTRRPLPGDSPRPTRSLPPSVHGDPDRPFGSLLHKNPRPATTTKDPFFEGLLQDMQSQKNGYLTTFLIKLFEYVAIMKKEYAGLLIMRLEPVFSRLHGQKQLIAFGEPLTTKLLHTVRLMNSAPADVVQSHAATAHYALTHRRTYLSPELNGIIDYADSLYNDIEGQNLLKTLKDVRLFPNITKTEKQLVDEIIDEALLAPYRNMKGTHKIQVLFDSINNAIIRRFPGMRRTLKKTHGVTRMMMAQSTLLNMYERVPCEYKNTIHENNSKHRLCKGKIKRNKHKKKSKVNIKKRMIYSKKRDFSENMDNYENLLRNNKKKHLQINKINEETKENSKRIIDDREFKRTKKIGIITRNNKSRTKKLFKVDNAKENTNKSKLIYFKRNTLNSDYSIEERDFKDKVNDVLRHGNMIENIFLRVGKERIAAPKNKINYFSSYSDEEGVIKQNIYKVFSNKLKE